mmetsp:Transcript_79162/g.226995  ORF Transcript_79162/g.226995 Transcript_79162/m.226995 type:complete len:273 (-) Transcript_79162:707-1525(-)
MAAAAAVTGTSRGVVALLEVRSHPGHGLANVVVKQCCRDDHLHDHVRVHVRRWSSVLVVAAFARRSLHGDTDGRGAVPDGEREFVDAHRLVVTHEAQLVVRSVSSHVLLVPALQSLAMFQNCLEASWRSGRCRGVVRVPTDAGPIRHWLRREGDVGHEQFGHSLQQVASHPQVVRSGDADGGPHLELPLPGRDLRVDAANLDAGVQAGTVVCLHEVAARRLRGTGGAEVRALRAGEAVRRPAQRPIRLCIQEVILLLKSEPRLLTCCQGPLH